MQSTFEKRTGAVSNHSVREAIRRRAIAGNADTVVWQIPTRYSPTMMSYMFVDYGKDGRWKTAITVSAWEIRKPIHEEFAGELTPENYLYTKRKVGIAVHVQANPTGGKAEFRRAQRKANRLVRGIVWDALLIGKRIRTRSVPVGAIPVATSKIDKGRRPTPAQLASVTFG